jgi:uncharacterized membrane protein YfcA
MVADLILPMNTLEMTLLIAVGATLAGFLGALTGLGGGVVIVPMLHVIFGVDLHYAIGAALVSVIATSSGAAAAYVKEGFSNVRVGMFLEIATTLGALLGAYLEGVLPTHVVAIIFGLVLVLSSYLSSRPRTEAPEADHADPLATRLRLDSTYPTPEGFKAYHVHGVPGGFAMMFLAGTLSGLLGIGSGALKVLAMDQIMKLPFKVSTTTSNFMIGVTAAASAGIYLHRGQIVPGLAFPVVIGVLTGAFLGTHVLVRAQVRSLRIIFSLVILALAAWMIYSAVFGG